MKMEVVKIMKVAEILANTIKSYDLEYFFLFTGGDQPLWIALKEAGIKMILTHSEHAATYMADGYAKISGKPTFVYGQYGPGAANVAGAFAEPYWGRSPLISLTTSIRTISRDRYEYQEIDQIPMYRSVTKWDKSVISEDRTADMLRSAIRHAVSPPPGPVHLELPSDFLSRDVNNVEVYAEGNFKNVPPFRVSPSRDSIQQLLKLLASAEKPLIIAGTGVIVSGAWSELQEVAEKLSIPVATTMGGKGSIPEQHKLSIGVIGRYSRKVANDIAKEADAVLVIGSRLGAMPTDTYNIPSKNASIIHVDIDPTVLGTVYKETLSIVGDAKITLELILDEIEKQNIKPNSKAAEWAEIVYERRMEWEKEVENEITSFTGKAMHPGFILKELEKVLHDDDIVVADTGYMGAWAGVLYTIKKAGKTFLHACGSLSWSFPAALGASLAAPDKKVVAIIGDGGIGYNIMELETAIRYHIPVMVIVMNNNSLAFEYHDQKYNYKKVVSEVNDFTDVNYAAVARAIGAKGQRITKATDVDSYLEEAYNSRDPFLLDIIVDKEVPAPVTVYDNVIKRKI